MITLNVLDNKTQHFTVQANEPVRIEVSLVANGRIMCHVYNGAETDPEQEPLGCYDGTIGQENRSWTEKGVAA